MGLVHDVGPTQMLFVSNACNCFCLYQRISDSNFSFSLSLFCSLLASCSHTKLHPSLALCCVELGSIHLSLLHSIYRQKSTVGFSSLSLSQINYVALLVLKRHRSQISCLFGNFCAGAPVFIVIALF